VRGSLAAAAGLFLEAITNAGIRRIEGALVADTTFIRGPEYGSGWSWDDAMEYYGAEISALTFGDNVVDLRVRPGAEGQPCHITVSPPAAQLIVSNRTETGAASSRLRVYRPIDSSVVYVSGRMQTNDPPYTTEVTLPEPAAFFLEHLRAVLEKNGVQITGSSHIRNWLSQPRATDFTGWIELGTVASLPMRDLLREVQKPSQNLYTDLLLAYTGESTRTTETATSEDLGIADLNRLLRGAGIPSGDVQFEEGSGLSRNNLCTARATVALLKHMAAHPHAAVYAEALPIAGVDGTLRNRMKNTAAAGNVKAKTGTLRWANSLSGYVQTAAGERLAFSLMLNRYVSPEASHSARAELDRLAVLLAEFAGRTSPP
jgi:D-alanyl-D-alanine carboxypeptidase/D-alanyl-D-alanine-endopeptidase (penicillin-binding protein 4)